MNENGREGKKNSNINNNNSSSSGLTKQETQQIHTVLKWTRFNRKGLCKAQCQFMTQPHSAHSYT